MIISGTPAIFKVGLGEILFNTVWKPTADPASFGILWVILTSIVGTTLAILLGVPVGILSAVFIAEVAPKRVAAVVKPAVELLAGIPSVVYGLLGIYILNPLMYKLERVIFAGSATHQYTGGANLISAVLVLAIMILPTVINISETSIRAVPAQIKAASLALGASKIQTIFKSILPAARSGIVTAVVLGIGRAIGEAMAITLVSGSSVNAPLPFNSVRFLTTAIVSEMGYAEGLHRQVLFTIGLVLFVFIMLINMTLNKLLQERSGGRMSEKTASLTQKKTRGSDIVLLVAIYVSASVSVLLLAGIIGYVFVKGIHTVNWTFLTSVTSALKNTVGIAGNLVNTLYIIVITLLIVTPLGVGAAIYLNEYAKPGKLVSAIEFTTETLSGIPSIIYGLFGMIFFGQTLHFGYSILTGSLTLTLMVLPLITRNTQEALRTVPDSYRNGALGMGATKWYMIRTILLPSALPGIVTGIILSVGRIVGESAALLFTAGSGRLLPKLTGDFLGNLKILGSKAMTSGGTLTIELYLQMQNGKYDVAFGIACVLLVIVLFINLLTKLAARKLHH